MPVMIWSGRLAIISVLFLILFSCSEKPEKLIYGIIPAVTQMDTLNGGIELSSGWSVLPTENVEDLANELQVFFKDKLSLEIENREMPSKTIFLLEFPDKEYGREGYRLKVKRNNVVIEAAGPIGISRGISSLKQLILLNEKDG